MIYNPKPKKSWQNYPLDWCWANKADSSKFPSRWLHNITPMVLEFEPTSSAYNNSEMWWHTPLTPALGNRPISEFKAILVCRVLRQPWVHREAQSQKRKEKNTFTTELYILPTPFFPPLQLWSSSLSLLNSWDYRCKTPSWALLMADIWVTRSSQIVSFIFQPQRSHWAIPKVAHQCCHYPIATGASH